MGSRRLKEVESTNEASQGKSLVNRKSNKTVRPKRNTEAKKVDNNKKKNVKNKNIKYNLNNVKQTVNKGSIKVIPLGGLEEVGKNITVFEYEDEMIVVDCGLTFPDDSMLGVDIVIPDFTYLEKNKDRIKGLVITHGHEDHIGAVPYLFKKLMVPTYSTPFTIALIEAKLKEHGLDGMADLHTVNFGDVVDLGKMQVEFIASAHSIPDSAMLAIKSPAGTIVHTGDFKVEYTPVDGVHMDLPRLGQLGREGVLAMLSDSTNSEKKGFTMSEASVSKVFDKIFENCKKRIIVSTFASNVNRVQGLVNLAQKYGRKIAVSGRSMEKVLEIARELEYIDAPDSMFVELDNINNVDDEKLLIITTGSQGEPMAALTRIATGQHKKIKLRQNDLVIISATPIPGNEPSISVVINGLIKKGVEVIYSSLEHVHVSGHACQEEQKLMIDLVKPKYFLPVHGEPRQLHAHRATAIEMGYTMDNVLLMENGKVLELSNDEAKFTGKVESGKTFVDGLGIGDVGNIVLRDRQLLANDGVIIVVMNLDQKAGNLVSEPDIISRGFIYVKENEELLTTLKGIVVEALESIEEKEWGAVKAVVKSKLQRYIYKTTKREPMILPIVVEI